jgi:hypothetical protein
MKIFSFLPKYTGDYDMKQYEAVIEVMKSKGGYATLGDLYKEVFNVEKVKWGTQTPFASIRRIVQDERFFFKIKPGLWALKTHKADVMHLFELESKSKSKNDFNHSYYQGLLLEIGNLKQFQTFIPYQDKNRKYLEKPLKELATIDQFYNFSYDHIVNRAASIDVSWFNERKLPHTFFEVEHSTDFKNSLLKFVELQDFNVEFRIVADKVREKHFRSIMTFNAFKSIEHRVKFLSYELVAEIHVKTVELCLIENKF